MKILKTLVLTVLVANCGGPRNPFVNSEITVEELRHHIYFLASDSLKGRASGEEGNQIAAKYLAQEFKSYGIKPAGDKETYFQEFDVLVGLKAGEHNSLAIGDRRFQLETDFRPLAVSADTMVETTSILAGYGISSAGLNYDDYAGIDVSGKVVVVLRYSPEGDNPHSKFYDYMALRRKAGLAAEKGAAGLIMVTGPADGEDELINLESDMVHSTYGIPAISARREVVCELLGITEAGLASYQKALNQTRKATALTGGKKVTLQTQVVVEKAETANVLGMLAGTDPVLKNEVIVVGAHFDHLGMGGSNSLYRGEPAIHNGADDNASGTGAILELAQKFATAPLKRSILFAGFSGEEMGLLGSKYFVSHATVDTGRIVLMCNFDMVGRLTDSVLIIHGTGTSPDFKQSIEELNRDFGFKLSLKDDGNGPSDFASFYQMDRPVLSFFTNLHSDYHRPSDDAEKINYEGEKEVTKFAYMLINRIGNSDAKPAFVRVQSAPERPMRGFKVTLGIIPSYGDNSEGLKVDGVTPGKAADLAGMKKGDLIIKFGGKTIRNVYDYTYALGEFSVGDEVKVVVVRDGKELTLTAVMQKSSR